MIQYANKQHPAVAARLRARRGVSLHSRGFTMVEVLVALVVLSVGMLGVAGLYVYSLQNSGSAIYRTQAINLAADMADRMRANRNAGTAYVGDPAGSQTCIGTTDCSPEALAADDKFQWLSEIGFALPSGDGLIALDAMDGGIQTYQITVLWTEPSTSIEQSFVMSVEL